MRRFLTLTLGALCALAVVAPSAPAKLRTCPSQVYYEYYKVRDVSCAKAKQVVKAFLDDGERRSGFTCREKENPTTLIICRKGDKKIEYGSE